MAKKNKVEKKAKIEVNSNEEITPPLVTGDPGVESWDKLEPIENDPIPEGGIQVDSVNPVVPGIFVGGHSSKDNTSVTEPLPVWTNGEIKDSASELKDPEFHESEPEVKPSEITDAPSKPRYHRQDVVNIAQVVYEAQKALATTEGDNSYKGWDNEDDNKKTELIGYIDTVLTENLLVIVDKKTVKLTHAIVNALK